MKRFIISAFSALTCMAANSQSHISWNLVPVPDRDNIVVGFIYHTEALGTEKNHGIKKVPTSLRLICSTKLEDVKMDPIIAVLWSNLESSTNIRAIGTTIKGNVLSIDTWTQDGDLLYRSAISSDQLMDSMKHSKSVRFSWISQDSTKYDVVFDLKEFKNGLDNFNRVCHSKL